MVEDEARTKWCPFVRILDGQPPGGAATNREGRNTNCIGSECMAWRWGERLETEREAYLRGTDLRRSFSLSPPKHVSRETIDTLADLVGSGMAVYCGCRGGRGRESGFCRGSGSGFAVGVGLSGSGFGGNLWLNNWAGMASRPGYIPTYGCICPNRRDN
jgi:hypothetical protein